MDATKHDTHPPQGFIVVMHKVLNIFISLILIASGVTVMSGWLLQIPILVQFKLGLVPMVFNTALCFTLSGIALLLDNQKTKVRLRVQTAIGAFLFVLCGLTFIEITTDKNWGIDLHEQHLWIADGNVRPGRMAPNTALGFILTAIALILIPRVTTKYQALLVQILTFSILAIGLTGLVGYVLSPDLLFGWARSARMAIPTACGMILIASGLWLSWNRAQWYSSRHYLREDEKITFIGTAILIVVTITAGLAGFAAQQSLFEKSLQERLQVSMNNRLGGFYAAIKQATDDAQNTARNLEFIVAARNLIADNTAANIENQQLIKKFYAIAVQDTHNNKRWQSGTLMHEPRFNINVNSTTQLYWNDGLYLHTESEIFDGETHLGYLVLEHSLNTLYSNFFNTEELGQTGEVILCMHETSHLLCLSPKHTPEMFTVKTTSTYGKPFPVLLALKGESGVMEAIDYRDQNVIAAYSSVYPGLGVVNKQETIELYADIRHQLKIVMQWLLLCAVIGAILLRSQLQSLAHKLVTSEAIAADKEQYISTLLSSVGEGILTIDDDGIIESLNPSAEKIFAKAAAEIAGQHFKNLMPLSTHPALDATMARYKAGDSSHIIGQQNVELPGLRGDGSIFKMELNVSEMHINNRHLFVAIVRDITERKKSEQELFAEKERLRVTLRSIGDAVITADTNGLITYLNPIAEIMTGWSHEDAYGKPTPEVFHIIEEHTQQPALDPIQTVLQSKVSAGLMENTILIQRHTGHQFPIEDSAAPISGKGGNIIGVVLVFRDVSKTRKMAAEMTYQATHDSLTGLINRREFERRIEGALNISKTQHKENTLLYLDLDRFKIVNDTCGHVAGDELLRQLSSLLQKKLRQTDTLARLGGDEFGVLLESCSTETALKIAETIRLTVSDFHFVWKDKSFSVGVTIGLVTFCNSGITLTDVLQMADSACYVAKEKGRNRIQIYQPENQDFANRNGQMGWIDRIRGALTNNHFVLDSQQLLALNGDVSAANHHELLIRMNDHGTRTPPMAFIPAAERYGLMSQIDRWVVTTAFQEYALHNTELTPQKTYAINLSGTTLGDEDFLRFLYAQFKQYNIPPANICFEITETAAIANLTQAVKFIQELQAIGCLFALDDFGSGMSSFGYLKNLPVNFLKIDGSFVRDMANNPIDRAMVESINNIGHVMGIKTIAEGVENEATIQLLRDIGVDFAQGYAIQKPEPFRKPKE